MLPLLDFDNSSLEQIAVVHVKLMYIATSCSASFGLKLL